MNIRRVAITLLVTSVTCGVPTVFAEDPDLGLLARLGDINIDGSCDIRDIQASIAQALSVAELTREGDVDENGMVDIYDVQHIVNTALEAGGMVQHVRGRVEYDTEAYPSGMHMRAVSEDGQSVTDTVDPHTGEFAMRLRVGTSWSFACIANDDQEGQGALGIVSFPIADRDSSLMPVPELSMGDELDLGHFQFSPTMRSHMDMRAMHGQINGVLNDGDEDGNGIPDFADPLVHRAHMGPGVFEDMQMATLDYRVAPCIESWLDEISAPSLTDINQNEVPDFIEPLMVCLTEQIPGWFERHGHAGGMMGGGMMGKSSVMGGGMMTDGASGNEGMMGGGMTGDGMMGGGMTGDGMMGGGMTGDGMMGDGMMDDTVAAPYVQEILDYVIAAIPEWIENLEHPDLIDSDGNAVPDFLDALLVAPGGSGRVDSDGDGLPDFAQDHDGDGIPNCLDEDAWTSEDCDGDGIPNHWDRDDDNDEVPDYADVTPCGDEIS